MATVLSPSRPLQSHGVSNSNSAARKLVSVCTASWSKGMILRSPEDGLPSPSVSTSTGAFGPSMPPAGGGVCVPAGIAIRMHPTSDSVTRESVRRLAVRRLP
jgi:hypothetical protein